MNGRRIAFASALVAILSAAPAASWAEDLAMSPTARFVQSARERAASLTWYTDQALGSLATATRNAGRAIRHAGHRSIEMLSSVPLAVRRTSLATAEATASDQPECRDGCQAEAGEVCETEEPCCPEFWEHRTGLFGDFLYLSAREQDLPYATPVDGTIAGATPLGPTQVLDPSYSPGFRVGGSVRLGPLSSIQGTYWYYRSTDTDFLSMPGGTGWVRSEVTHPSTLSVASDSLSANASYDIDFQMADAVYRHVIWGDRNYAINVAVGARYGHLDQQFHGDYSILGNTEIITDINFDGAGPRLGLDGEWLFDCGFLVYGNAFASFLAGEIRADYRQSNTFVGQQAQAGIVDDRIVPQLELELGIGWQNACGSLRVKAGYYLGAWYGVMTTPSFIKGVQANSLADLDENLVFDGMVIRGELRF